MKPFSLLVSRSHAQKQGLGVGELELARFWGTTSDVVSWEVWETPSRSSWKLLLGWHQGPVLGRWSNSVLGGHPLDGLEVDGSSRVPSRGQGRGWGL